MATALFTHGDCLAHVNPRGHPEQVARLERIIEALSAPEFAGLIRRDAPLASDADILLCHPAEYLADIRARSPREGRARLDSDTHMSPGSLTAALRAAGGAIAAVDHVLDGPGRNAFVACRPPGHHAEMALPMGFCIFGNVAIAARHALERRGLSRVAVVDFDVHHGNGTQALLWREPRVKVITSQQMPLWPGTGAPEEKGQFDNVLNLPLPPGSDGAAMRAAYRAQVFPVLDAFAPELLLISAGFDAHRADPLAALEWVEDDYAWLTDRICDIADTHAGGRVVSVLEGGYDLDALAASVAVHVGKLMER